MAYTREERRAYDRAWRAKNREKILGRRRAWRLAHLDEERARQRAWQLAHPDRVKAAKRRTRAKHADKIKAYMADYRAKNAARLDTHGIAYRDAHRERINEHARWYTKTHPEGNRFRVKIRKYRIRGATGSHTRQDELAILSVQRGLCYYCSAPMGTAPTVDHKVPITRGGSDNKDNLVFACRSCNSRKHTKTAEEFIACNLGRAVAA